MEKNDPAVATPGPGCYIGFAVTWKPDPRERKGSLRNRPTAETARTWRASDRVVWKSGAASISSAIPSLIYPKFSGASEADVRAACAQTAFEAGRWFDFPEGSWGRTPQIIDNLVEREILLRQKFE